MAREEFRQQAMIQMAAAYIIKYGRDWQYDNLKLDVEKLIVNTFTIKRNSKVDPNDPHRI